MGSDGRRAAQRRGRRRRNVVVASGAVAVVAAGGGVAWAMTDGSGTAYRLAAVTRATVQQTVSTSGTVSSANSATLRFPVAGTVAAVDVRLGAHVSAGQTVATLDTSVLEQQVRDAQATAASARQTLASDEASQTSGSSSSNSSNSSAASASSAASSPSATPTATPTRPSSGAKNGGQGGGGSSTALAAQVRAAQQKVIADQRAADLDADVAAADKAVAAENTACASLLNPSSTATATPTASPSTSASASPTGSASGSTTDLQNCQDAIAAVQTAQHAVQADIDALTADEAALDHAVTALLQSLASSGSGGASNPSAASTSAPRASAASTAGGASNASNNASQRSSNPGGGASGGVATAADLAADQARIDAADAQVTVAQQDLAQAALSTPISGTVGAISIAAGDSVTAGSTTATITVIGAGQKEVTTTIGIADVDLVKKGETAHVTVDGTTTPITGQVTQVGFLNTSGTSGSTTTYPVTIVLNTTRALFDGAGASVAIDVGSAANVLTVPTSAVHKVGRLATVSVYRNGKVSTVPVTLGIEDSDRTEVRSGVAAGDQVVLADVSAAVPTSDVASNLARRFGGTGGLGGGGLGGGGLGGGSVQVVPGGK